MWISNFRSAMLIALGAVFITCCYSQSYSDLEALGINCPARDKCEGYRNHLTYMDRSCECDNDCTAYKDCCIDRLPTRRTQASRPQPRTDVKCLHYGEDEHTGVFVISKCSSSWNGARKIQEKCLRGDDFRDPLVAAPVTDEIQKITYRNLACAECNNANLASLKTFQLRVACDGIPEGITEAQIMGDLTYNEQFNLWGLNRLNRHGNDTEFIGCDIIFDVPEYLNNSVRFCRSNLISKCATDWTRPVIASYCAQYMAAVYSNTEGYRNPHCAICNHKTVDEISCQTELISRKRKMSFGSLIDVNRSDGDRVGMRPMATPQCPSGKIYDPFVKGCRQLMCALPGHVLVDGRCVRG